MTSLKTENSVSIGLRFFIGLFMIFVYLFISLKFDVGVVSSSLGSDSTMVLYAVDQGVDNLSEDKSTRFMAEFVNLFGGYEVLKFVNWVFSSVLVFSCLLFSKSLGQILAFCFVLIACFIAYMRVPHKETVLLFFYSGLYLAYLKGWLKEYFILVVLAFFLFAYAFSARAYYYLILMTWFLLAIFFESSSRGRFLLSLLIIFAFFLVPFEYFKMIQSVRDSSSWYRILYPEFPGYRTAFVNLLPVESKLNFLINYVYGVVRLNFPLPFYWTVKELLHIFVIVSYYFLICGSFTKSGEFEKKIRLLIFSHFLIFWVFEPDLGSYMRHGLSTLPLVFFLQDWRRVRFLMFKNS